MSIEKRIEEDSISFSDENGLFLTVNESATTKTALIEISGELRSEVKHEFQDEMEALISVGLNLDLDLSKVSYVTYSYLRVLIMLEQIIEKKNHQMRLINPSDCVKEMLVKTGGIDLLLVEEVKDEV